MDKVWAVRAQNFEGDPKTVHKTKLVEEDARMWLNRFNTQGYKIVAMMMDKRGHSA